MSFQKSVASSKRSGLARGKFLLASGVSLTILCLATAPAMAQETTVLKKINVTGESDDAENTTVVSTSESGTKTGTPILDTSASVSVVTAKEMEKRGAQTVMDAVAYSSSVTVDEYGSDDRYDYYRIRGFDQTAKGSYRDGLSARIIGWFLSPRFEAYGLERVEVLKGSTSTLFGLNSPGGLVNAITKKPRDTAHHEVYTTVGIHNHVEAGFDIGGPLDEEGVYTYRLTGKARKATQGYEYSKDNLFYIAPALTISPDEGTKLTIMADYNKLESTPAYSIPPGSGIDITTFLGEPGFFQNDIEQFNIGYQFEHDFDNGLSFRQNARYSKVGLTYKTVYGATTTPYSNREAFQIDGTSDHFAIDNQLQYDTTINGAESKTLLGVDYSYAYDRERNYYSSTVCGIDVTNPVYCGYTGAGIPDYFSWNVEQHSTGVYAQEELTLFDRLILTGGLRYDYVKTYSDYLTSGTNETTYKHALTKRLGATYKVSPQISVYGNYSESFEPLVSPVANNYSSIIGNIKDQRGTQYEAGIKYRPDGFNGLFTLAYFDLTRTNVPSWNGSYTTLTQTGEVNVRGIEVEGKFELNDQWNATFAYAYWNATIKDDAVTSYIGNRPSLVPEHVASAWVDYTIPGEGNVGDITLGGGVRFVGSRYNDNTNTTLLDAYTLFDAMVSYKINKNLTFSVNAKNLFNREYVSAGWSGSSFYGDGRNVMATLKATW